MFSSIANKLNFEARNFGHYRFEEPIVVFESDDWGKVSGQADGVYPSEFGTRTDWSFDQLESAEELEKLFEVLESFNGDFERPPVFTANFVVSNPDFEETKACDYKELKLKAISTNFPELLEKWRLGKEKNVFYPQYHGKLHYNMQRYQDALLNDEKTRFLFDQGINGGLENFVETKYALYSEYQNCQSKAEIEGLRSWIADGLDTFELIFGYRSKSAISPNYVSPPAAIAALAKTDLKYLQASNKILWVQNGKEQKLNYCQGTELKEGLLAMSRNHKFEPCRGKKEWMADFSIFAAHSWIKQGIPAVLDTHRMNYVGRFAENSRAELRKLLASFRKYPNLKFLSTAELGEAIANNGNYTCVFTGEKKQITPKDNFLRKQARTWVK